jgi:hypothetical protein
MLKASFLFGFTVLLTLLASSFSWFVLSVPQSNTYAILTLVIIGYVCLMLTLAYFSQLFMLGIGLYFTRGPGSVGWVPPRQCHTLNHWVGFSWEHYSSKGLQTGFRVLGFEFALKGNLSSI